MKKSISILAAILLITALFVSCNAEAGTKSLVTLGFNVGNVAEATKFITATDPDVTGFDELDYYVIKATDNSDSADDYLAFYLSAAGAETNSNHDDGVYEFTVTKAAFAAASSPYPNFVLTPGSWTFEVWGYDEVDEDDDVLIGYGKTDLTVGRNTAPFTVYLDQKNSETVTLKVTFGEVNNPVTTPYSATEDGYRFALYVNGNEVLAAALVTEENEDGTATATYADPENDVYVDTLAGYVEIPNLESGWVTVRLDYEESSDNGVTWTTSGKFYDTDILLVNDGELVLTGELTEGPMKTPGLSIVSHVLTFASMDKDDNDNAKINAGAITLDRIEIDPTDTEDAYTVTYAWKVNGVAAGTSDSVTFSYTPANVANGTEESGYPIGYYVVTCKVTVEVDGEDVPYTATSKVMYFWNETALTQVNPTPSGE